VAELSPWSLNHRSDTRRVGARALVVLVGLFWVVNGVAELSAFGICPRHGAEHIHAAGSRGPEASFRIALDEEEFASDHVHGSHASGHDHGAHAAPSAFFEAEGEPDEHGCDCRWHYCGVTAVASAPEAVVTAVPDTNPAVSTSLLPRVDEARVPITILPFFLPPSNAPPSS